jgi:hypothetical protein
MANLLPQSVLERKLVSYGLKTLSNDKRCFKPVSVAFRITKELYAKIPVNFGLVRACAKVEG